MSSRLTECVFLDTSPMHYSKSYAFTPLSRILTVVAGGVEEVSNSRDSAPMAS